jgi:hypothetical protein
VRRRVEVRDGPELVAVLTAVGALRRGHYELWKGSLAGTPLAKLGR